MLQGATAQTVVIPLQVVNGIVNPAVAAQTSATAKARIAARAAATGNKADANVACDQDACQYLSLQTDPCDSSAYGTCAQDLTCSAYDHPGCNGCCTNPIGAIYQESGTLPINDINIYCSSSLDPSSTKTLCLPCPPGSVPIIRPCGNDCRTLTYYTCTTEYVAVSIFCNAQANGTMNYAVVNSNNSTVASGSLSTNGTSVATVYMTPGTTLNISNVTAQSNTTCVSFGGYPSNVAQTAELNSFALTYANFSGNSATITLTGTACGVPYVSCSNNESAVACTGTMEVVLTGVSSKPESTFIPKTPTNCHHVGCGWSTTRGSPVISS